MADVTAKAVVNVYASTAEAVKEFNKLSDATKKYGSELKETDSKIKGFIDAAAIGFAKFNLAVGGVQKAFELLNSGLNTALDQTRLQNMERMLPTGSVDRLRDATEKLISRNDVLRLSVKGLTGDFALTEPQMQKVLKASIALSQKTGESAAVISDKLLDALAKGVNKLDDFGINLEKTGDRAADVNAAMTKFDQIIRETPVDSQTKSLTQLKDALLEIGNAVAGIITIAVEGIALLNQGLKALGVDLSDPTSILAPGLSTADKMRKRKAAAGESIHETLGGAMDRAFPWQRRSMVGTGLEYAREFVNGPQYYPTEEENAAAYGIDSRPFYQSTPFLNRGRRKGGRDPEYIGPRRGPEELAPYAGANQWGGVESIAPESIGILNRPGYNIEGADNFYGATGDQSQAISEQKAAKYMEGLGDRATGAGAAFGVFTDSFGAAVQATIDGSEGMAKAFARASAASLKALAVEYAVRALGEGAYAIASLAYGDAKGATAHGLAALKFAAAAAAAGIGSHALGSMAGSSGGNTTSAGGGYASPTGGRASGGAGDTIVINIGEGFYGDTDKLSKEVSKAVREGKRRGERETYSATHSG